MKKWIFPFSIGLISLFIYACQNQVAREPQNSTISSTALEKTSAEMMDSATGVAISAEATPSVYRASKSEKEASQNQRKIIRTASIKSKVDNTEHATYKIEQLTKQFGGFITQSHLESKIRNEHSMPICSDSIMKVAAIQVSNNIILRVPNTQLDTFLVELSRLYTFLEYRKVSSEDVTNLFLSHQLKAQIRDKATKQIQSSVQASKHKLDDITDATSSAVLLKDEAIDHQTANLETNYKVEYSEVNLEIYQQEIIGRFMAINPLVLESTSNWGYRFQEAFKNGGTLILDALVGLMNLWAVFVLGFLAWLIYRKYHHLIHL